MAEYSVATTKDKLSSLIDKALAGEEVIITRHGKPTVELRMIAGELKSVRTRQEWMDWLRERRVTLRVGAMDSLTLIREMREEGEH